MRLDFEKESNKIGEYRRVFHVDFKTNEKIFSKSILNKETKRFIKLCLSFENLNMNVCFILLSFVRSFIRSFFN